MTLVQALVFLVLFAIVAYLAYWVITKFFPAPAQMPALAIVGLLLLLGLLSQVWPEAAGFRLFR